jgi:hypothetical protein
LFIKYSGNTSSSCNPLLPPYGLNTNDNSLLLHLNPSYPANVLSNLTLLPTLNNLILSLGASLSTNGMNEFTFASICKLKSRISCNTPKNLGNFTHLNSPRFFK